MFVFQAQCMGTGFTFQIEGEPDDSFLQKMSEAALEILEDANQRFSLYLPESEISRLVSGELDWAKASLTQLTIRDQVAKWHSATAGYFDAKVGTAEYDPSGLVKSWATNNAANFLLANGIRRFTINAGGDVILSPELNSEVLSRVGLSNLVSIASSEAGSNIVLDLKGSQFRAVATSGVSERGEHIWRSDDSAAIIQVSVIGVDLVEADIWATAIVSGGLAAWSEFLRQPQKSLRALVTTREGALFSSPGFTELLARL